MWIKSICTVFVSSLTNHDQSISIKVHLFQKRNSPAQCFYYRNHFSIYFGFLRKNSELRRNSQVCNRGPQVIFRFQIYVLLDSLLKRMKFSSLKTCHEIWLNSEVVPAVLVGHASNRPHTTVVLTKRWKRVNIE